MDFTQRMAGLSADQRKKYHVWKKQLLRDKPIDPLPIASDSDAMQLAAEWAEGRRKIERRDAEVRADHRRYMEARRLPGETVAEQAVREKREARQREREADARRIAHSQRIRKYGARLESMIEKRLRDLEVAWTRSGYRFKWGSGNSRYWHVYVSDRGHVGDMYREDRLDEYLATIRLSDHRQPVGGGFSMERQTRFGDADLSIDPASGGWLDDIEPLIVAKLKEAAQ